MDDEPITQARKRLTETKGHEDSLWAAARRSGGGIDIGRVDHAAMTAALAEVRAAERELARVSGQEYAVELVLDLKWCTGAPLPFLVSNGRKAAVVFFLETNDPGTEASGDTVERVGAIEFDGVYDVKLGGLNDEAIRGHPLWGKGMDTYTAHEIINSAWITESENRNAVHPAHRGGWHQRLKHYLVCFHDETLECLATGLRTKKFTGSFSDAVAAVTEQLLN